MGHIVGFGEEPRGAQDDRRQPGLQMIEPAQMLGRKLGDAIDVARLGDHVFGKPRRARGPARQSGADRFRNHQRSGRGEHETADAVGDRFLEQVERAADVDLDEILARAPLDVGLVQGAAMHDRIDAVLGDRPPDEVAVGNRADKLGMLRRGRVEPDHHMAERAQSGGQRLAQPARRSGEQDSHCDIPSEMTIARLMHG